MAKGFLEVFPDLHITDEMEELLKLVEVERVSSTRDRSSLRIYIVSQRLIHKKNIYDLEKGIREQLFPGKQLTIKIVEKYRLSGQYTPEKLLQVYKDSLLMELKNYSIIEYNILRKAECTFPQDHVLHMTVEDNAVFRAKSGELKRVLEKVFYERCGLPVEVTYEYVPVKENRQSLQREAQIQKEIEERLRSSPLAAELFGDEAGDQSGETAKGLSSSYGASADGRNLTGNGAGKPEKSAAGGVSGRDREEKKQAGLPGAAQPGKTGGDKAAGGFSGRQFSKDRKFGGGYQRKSDKPDVLYGRDFDDEFVSVRDIGGEMGEVTIRGKIINTDSRLLNSGKTIVIFDVTDFTDTITVKLFAREEALEDINKAVVKGSFIKLKGMTTIDKFDGELTIGSVVGMKKCEDFTGKRSDNSLIKRVELHCHTKMSDMDGVSDVKDIIKRAKKWGMPAIAVTDHGCVQAFTDANHALDKGDEFKIIYGVEGYLVDDTKQLVENSRNQDFDDPYVVFDIETTGFSPLNNKIIEIGAVKVERGVITEKFSTFVNPEVPIPFRIEQLTSINDSMVLPAPKIDQVLPEFLEFCRGAALVAHNASFDISFIAHNAEILGLEFNPTVLDTVTLARVLLPQLNRYKLDTVAKALNISLENHHRAVDDAGATAEIFTAFLKMLKERGMSALDELNRLSELDAEGIKKLPTYHVIILAKITVFRQRINGMLRFNFQNKCCIP